MVIMDDLHSNPVYISSFLILFSETCVNFESIARVLNRFMLLLLSCDGGRDVTHKLNR